MAHEKDQPERPPSATSERSMTARVLVVEDDLGLLEVYGDTLRDNGFDVETAVDGTSALAALEKGSFDVVLSDVVMPGLTGVDLLRSVRAKDLDLPVLLITGSPSIDTAVQAVEMGALHYLLKPVATADLVRSIRNAARLKQLATAKREALRYLGDARAMGDRAGLEAVFGRALAQLHMVYQPIVRTRDGSVFAWEALLRTREPAVAGPQAFLELAERLGRLGELGRRIRASVAHAAAQTKGTVFFVNLHPDDLLDLALYDPKAPLTECASEIVLEITERSSIEAIGDVRERIARLRDLGFRLAVDDLGAGYAGLTSFAALEPEFVKLDRGLISGIHEEQVKRKLVGSLIQVSHDLGLSTIAEGIEQPQERDVLVDLGCHLMQGFLFRRPEEWPFGDENLASVNGI